MVLKVRRGQTPGSGKGCYQPAQLAQSLILDVTIDDRGPDGFSVGTGAVATENPSTLRE
jgi:hypothetical protein